ncbi:MAG: DegT/DnrJ/EryC1/StrS family aminotransferase [Actinomycetes bacterium]
MSASTLALLGGQPAFPDGLPLVRPVIDDVPGTTAKLAEVLESGQLTNGRRVRELEEHLAERLQVPHVVAVGSCTAGLMLVYQALGVRGRVVMPSATFSASAAAVVWAGGTPVFAEVEESRLTLDPADAATQLDGAAALSATHTYGHPAKVDELQALADSQGIPLVYDAAHGLGSTHAGRPVGGFGSAEVFSMSPTKVAVAGEGGIVATRDPELADAVRVGRNYGNPGDYDTRFPGLNARMSELHAVVAMAWLAGLDARAARRAALVDLVEAQIAGLPGVRVVRPAEGDTSTWKDLVLQLDPALYGLDAPALQRVLAAEGADSRRYFWPAIHEQKAYSQHQTRALPRTEALASTVLTPALPSFVADSVARDLGQLLVRAHEQADAVSEQLAMRNQG